MEKLMKTMSKKCEQTRCYLGKKWRVLIKATNSGQKAGLFHKFLSIVCVKVYTDLSLLVGGFAQFPHGLYTTTNLYINNKEEVI
jgi:hypothetical protein